jgi:hypothetical protein
MSQAGTWSGAAILVTGATGHLTPKFADAGLLDWPSVLKPVVGFDLDQRGKASDRGAGERAIMGLDQIY